MEEGKSFEISKHQVMKAYKLVKANNGAGGIDGVDFKTYEQNLKNNLYKLWNRMSSGVYFPKPVKGVEIPKKNGTKRLLGIPTIDDRVAQMVIRMELEPKVEPIFCDDSYGYRPSRSAIDAVGVIRKRCWQYPWLLEFDIKGLFDNIDHELLMKAVKKHSENKWVLLYINRIIKAPIAMPNGEVRNRESGTPQGGVISPILANIFLHYAFDKWMKRSNPNNKWARYADDAVIHCRSEIEAKNILLKLKERLKECKLEVHPDKTRIVYCRSDKFKGRYENESFDFLGYTFRRRYVKSKNGNLFNAFTPAVSKESAKKIKEKIRDINKRTKFLSIEELAKELNPIIRGWTNYFSHHCASEARKVLDYINLTLIRWVKRKYKRLKRSNRRAFKFMANVAKELPQLFYQWKIGIRPTIG